MSAQSVTKWKDTKGHHEQMDNVAFCHILMVLYPPSSVPPWCLTHTPEKHPQSILVQMTWMAVSPRKHGSQHPAQSASTSHFRIKMDGATLVCMHAGPSWGHSSYGANQGPDLQPVKMDRGSAEKQVCHLQNPTKQKCWYYGYCAWATFEQNHMRKWNPFKCHVSSVNEHSKLSIVRLQQCNGILYPFII